jgi:alkylation response protein AidB-like acyl-CoA dehydrogenase
MSTPSFEEQQAIRSAARSFARDRAPVSHFRTLRDAREPLGYSRDLWREMAALGFAGLAVPERWGGTGLGCAELGIVAEELGRNLVPTPLLSNVLAAGAVLLGGADALREATLSGVCSGERVLAFAHEEGARHAPYAIGTTAHRDRAGFVVDGEKSFVLDAHLADGFVVVARTSGAPGDRDGLTLLCVPSGPGVTTLRLDLVDSRNTARVLLRNVSVPEANVLGAVDRGADLLDRLLDRGAAVLAAEMLGGMQEAFDRTIAYLKTRKQYGVFIGSFQALKHRAAWMFCEIELTRSVVAEALRALDDGREDAPALVSAAKARASDTYVLVTNEAVQMHGGVGVTDELDIGLFMKRARSCEQTLGSAVYHRQRFGKLRGYG